MRYNCWAGTTKGIRCKRKAKDCTYFCKIHQDKQISDMFWMHQLKQCWPVDPNDNQKIQMFLKTFDKSAIYLKIFELTFTTGPVFKQICFCIKNNKDPQTLKRLGKFRLKYFHKDFYYFYPNVPNGNCYKCNKDTSKKLLCCKKYICMDCFMISCNCQCNLVFL